MGVHLRPCIKIRKFFYIFLCILKVLVVCPRAAAEQSTVEYVRPVCGGPLRWVPFVTKRPFISFMNDAYCPSWTTRHIITKLKQNTLIQVPRGLPFAFVVGVCYRPTRDIYSFSVSVKKSGEGFEQILDGEEIKTKKGEFEHNFRRHECMVKKFLTNNLTRPGRFICTAHFGILTVKEFVDFAITDVPVVKRLTALHLGNGLDKITLSCPSLLVNETEANPVVHVWYGAGMEVQNLTMSSSAVFDVLRDSQNFRVSCATYNILQNLQARVTDFYVRRSNSLPQVEVFEPPEESYVVSEYPKTGFIQPFTSESVSSMNQSLTSMMFVFVFCFLVRT